MALWNNFYLAQSLPDAVHVLATASGSVGLIAGGTDLLLDIQQGRHDPVDTLIDVTAIPELTALERRGAELYIGAAVPLNHIVTNPLVSHHAQALAEACGLIGGPQLRNTATLGGNVAHALPAGDGTIALLAMGADAHVAGPDGQRRVSLPELFLGPGKSALPQKREILVGFSVPLARPGEGSAFRRVMRPQGVAIAILNMAVWLARQGETIAAVRLAAGPTGPVPRRLTQAEDALRGHPLTEQTLTAATRAILAQAQYRTSKYRATAEYRVHLSDVLLRETLQTAWVRAGLNTDH